MFRKVATVYSALGSIWLTVSLILLLLNGLAWYWLSRPKPANPVVQRHGEVIYQAYPQRERAQVDRLLKEFFTQPSLVYEPYTQFKERPRNLDQVRVSGHGFRVHRPHGRWPIEDAFFNVFVFGGSTTFGYGVDMDDTIPARLQHHLARANPDRPLRVYNFGRGYYMSVQERVLFETLLLHGHRPDLAIFIDGVNDTAHWGRQHGKAEPFFSNFFRRASNELGKPALWKLETPLQAFLRRQSKADRLTVQAGQGKQAARRAPVVLPPPVSVCHDSGRIGADAATDLAGAAAPATDTRANAGAAQRAADDLLEWERFLDLWFTNKRMIESLGRAFGVDTLFVWQPHPAHRYRASEYHLLPERFPGLGVTRPYLLFEQRVRTGSPDRNLIVLSALQQDQQRNLYVDDVHYNPFFNDLIAARIAECVQPVVAKRRPAEVGGSEG